MMAELVIVFIFLGFLLMVAADVAIRVLAKKGADPFYQEVASLSFIASYPSDVIRIIKVHARLAFGDFPLIMRLLAGISLALRVVIFVVILLQLPAMFSGPPGRGGG